MLWQLSLSCCHGVELNELQQQIQLQYGGSVCADAHPWEICQVKCSSIWDYCCVYLRKLTKSFHCNVFWSVMHNKLPWPCIIWLQYEQRKTLLMHLCFGWSSCWWFNAKRNVLGIIENIHSFRDVIFKSLIHHLPISFICLKKVHVVWFWAHLTDCNCYPSIVISHVL